MTSAEAHTGLVSKLWIPAVPMSTNEALELARKAGYLAGKRGNPRPGKGDPFLAAKSTWQDTCRWTAKAAKWTPYKNDGCFAVVFTFQCWRASADADAGTVAAKWALDALWGARGDHGICAVNICRPSGPRGAAPRGVLVEVFS